MHGGNSQNLQLITTAYPTINRDVVLVPPPNRQLIVHSFIAVNNSTVAADLGFGIRYSSSAWKIYDQAGTEQVATDPIFTTVNNEGFILQAKSKFNGISIMLDDVATGTPVYGYDYWNGAAWSPLTLLAAPDFTAADSYVAFLTPIDWATGSGGLTPSFSPIQPGYAIRVRATTAGGQDVVPSSISLMRFIVLRRAVGSGMHLQVRFTERPMLLEAEEALVPYFGSAFAGNHVEAAYQVLL